MTRHPRIELAGAVEPGFDEVINADALEFVAELQHRFGPRREELLEARGRRRARLAEGEMLDFLPDTREIREGDWSVAPAPPDLEQRWVEITGPTDRKMTINALNSGADGFMADFEDANSPTWHNMVDGHRNLRDAIDGTITYRDSDGKALRALREPGHAAGPAARMAPGRAPPARRVRAGVRLAVRLRPVRVPLRPAADQKRDRAVLLPAEDGIPPRGAAVERRVRVRPGGARDTAGDVQGDRADRDAARRVRDGRDPVRAARALRRAQRRALGLHLLLDQVLPGPAARWSSRTGAT